MQKFNTTHDRKVCKKNLTVCCMRKLHAPYCSTNKHSTQQECYFNRETAADDRRHGLKQGLKKKKEIIS